MIFRQIDGINIVEYFVRVGKHLIFIDIHLHVSQYAQKNKKIKKTCPITIHHVNHCGFAADLIITTTDPPSKPPPPLPASLLTLKLV